MHDVLYQCTIIKKFIFFLKIILKYKLKLFNQLQNGLQNNVSYMIFNKDKTYMKNKKILHIQTSKTSYIKKWRE